MDTTLNENEVGFDADSIGFPSLKGCMAVVLQTDQGLFGWHVLGSDNLGPRAPKFHKFVRSQAGGTALRLYGVCNYKARFGGDVGKWGEEMTEIAAALGFKGPVQGFDLSNGTGIGADESTFAQFVRDATAGTCTIGFKRWSKMSAKGKVVNKDAEGNDLVVVRSIVKRGAKYKLEGTYNDKTTPGVDMVRTYWNKGRLHTASMAKANFL